MTHYTFTSTFRQLYDKAVARYAQGDREPAGYFDAAELAFLSSNGITAQHLYDYAEDFTNGGEPDFGTAIGIELIRRDYFLNVQGGRSSGRVLDETTLPAKTDTVRGIEWLPRIIPKAQAKLAGELPASVMYGCGGDRKFFRTHDVHPTEFLSLIWRNLSSPEQVVQWVLRRSNRP